MEVTKKFAAIVCAVSFLVGFLLHGDMFNNKTDEELRLQMEQAYEEGYKDGYEVGADKAYAEGYETGYADAEFDFSN